jgi:hypothetical protein
VDLDLALVADLVLHEEIGGVVAAVTEQLDNLALVGLVDQDGAVGREELKWRGTGTYGGKQRGQRVF